jgi:hypothetical protein
VIGCFIEIDNKFKINIFATQFSARCANVYLKNWIRKPGEVIFRMNVKMGLQTKVDDKPSLFGMLVNPEKQYIRNRTRPLISLPLLLMIVVASLTGLKMYYVNHLDLVQEIVKFSDRNPLLDFEHVQPVLVGLGVAGFGLDQKTPVTNLASVISAHGTLKGFLSVFEVFTIWCLILYASGIQVIAGLPKEKA